MSLDLLVMTFCAAWYGDELNVRIASERGGHDAVSDVATLRRDVYRGFMMLCTSMVMVDGLLQDFQQYLEVRLRS